MDAQRRKDNSHFSRRRFLRRSSLTLAGAAAAVNFPLLSAVHAAGRETEIKIGLIGCGGRGTGAVLDALGAATKVIYPTAGYHTEDVATGAKRERKGIQVVALADLFEDRLTRCAGQLAKLGLKIPKEMCFTGFDAYTRLLAVPEINYVILTTPPHFRPAHFKAAVEAGKHVFMEKPVAVDVPGVRTVIEAGELARQKGLGVGAGTQRRHQKSYQETIKRLHDGAIGEIVSARCYWDGSPSLGHRTQSRLERYGMAIAQLVLLHLAVRRSHCRATPAQPRRHELGAGGPSAPGRLRRGRTPGPHRQEIRSYLRPFRRRVRVSQRRPHV